MSSVVAGPEHETKHSLTKWLESHGARVWWEESNAFDHDLFTIDRDGQTPQSRPDLVVELDGRAFVIEFKPGESKSGVYDALLQIHGYWMNHIVHDQNYIVEDRPVKIDGFLTATKHSRFGRVFSAEHEGDLQTLEEMDDGRASCAEYGQLPPAEWGMTEQHVRTLWRLGAKSQENLITTGGYVPALGTLLSDHLETEQFDPTPAVLWNRGKTNQSWEVLKDE